MADKSTTLKPCPKCAAMPEKETQSFELGSYRDGGYPVMHGRYVCPVCGFGQSWEQSYSIEYGWNANTRKWNSLVSAYENRRANDEN